jgi:succinoglycan biosynthesis transport protein ExoP
MNYRFAGGTSPSLDRDVYSNEEPDVIKLEDLIPAARRQWKVVLSSIGVFLLLGLVFIYTSTPKYESSTRILIDTGNNKILDNIAEPSGASPDESSVLSQVEIVRSEKVAQAVSNRLNLRENREFISKSSMLDTLKRWTSGVIGSDAPPNSQLSDQDIQQAVIEKLLANLAVERLEKTYVLSLTYTSEDADLSAQIVKAFADSYVEDTLGSKNLTTRQASDWLLNRISTLREKALATDSAVQKFKSEKNLISTGGQLVSDQQLSEINSQLAEARSEVLSTQSKLSGIEMVIAAGKVDSAVSDSLGSPVVNKLRDQYLAAARVEADLSSRFGPDHSQVVRLRSEMANYQRLIFEELKPLAQSYRNAFQIAKSRESSLIEQLKQATTQSEAANNDQVQLRELQQEADTYRDLYRTFLQRYQEAVQQESFQSTQARVIADPVPALKPSSPKKGISLAFAGLLGLAFGFGVGTFREWRDRFFRTGDQVRSFLNLEFIGNVPLGKGSGRRKMQTTGAPAIGKVQSRNSSITDYVLDYPLSGFAETIRRAKLVVDSELELKKTKVVGFVSVFPGEGKSTLSMSFAKLLASEGSTVLLMDADLRNPESTRVLGGGAQRGIVEALTGGVPISDLVIRDETTNLSFLPAVVKTRIPFSSELLSSPAMAKLISDASSEYDYIVVDLPPLAMLVDARAMTGIIDSYIVVVEWGKTVRNAVKKTMLTNPKINEKCAGVILNKVDPERIKLYESSDSGHAYSKHYSGYFEDA